MKRKAEIYQEGNPFQKQAYKQMSDHLIQKGFTQFGASSKGNLYCHLLPPESTVENFLFDEGIYTAAATRFEDHKAGDWDRARLNTAASQPCCFNLFVPLQQDLALAGRLFSPIMGISVAIDHIEIEFTPNTPRLDLLPGFERQADESIGDQASDPKQNQGTDADIAVFYRSNGTKGVILIEFKYIEEEFNLCGSYKIKAKNDMLCTSPDFYLHMIEEQHRVKGRMACGYLKYNNWPLTQSSELMDITKIRALQACPFRFSLNQLWRNILLAESVKKARDLDDCHFWVLAPDGNDKLWDNHKEDVEERLRSILTSKGQEKFRKLTLEAVVDHLTELDPSPTQQNWLAAFQKKYFF